MKLILGLILSFGIAVCAYAGGEKKEVCTDVKDKAGKVVTDKAGKPKQSCKIIKVHKKVEGDKVPEPAKKK
jgi:hypothetical protein